MIRDKPKKVPKNEVYRYYKVERDPNVNLRILKCDWEELEDEYEQEEYM